MTKESKAKRAIRAPSRSVYAIPGEQNEQALLVLVVSVVNNCSHC